MKNKNILLELKHFIALLTTRPPAKHLSTQVTETSIRILSELPAAREVVFEYFGIVFQVSVNNHLDYLASNKTTCNRIEQSNEAIKLVEEEFVRLVSKGSLEWSVYIASWCLEVIGNISHKHCSQTDIASSCNFWLNVDAMKSLLGITATCFRKLGPSDSDNSINVLLSTFRKYSPTFDWVVSRLASCFPLQIISQILKSGYRKFCEDSNSRFHSEVSVLEYLSFAHENDLRKAINHLLEEGISPNNSKKLNIVPFLLEMCNYSEIILHYISSVFLEIYNGKVLKSIVQFINGWMQNKLFQNMQPAFNNLILKLKSEGTKILIIIARLTDEFKWCHTYLEYTLQEIEQIILLNRTCPMLQNLSSEDSKQILWESCQSENRVEKQTALRLILLVSAKSHHIYHQTIFEMFQKDYFNDSENIGLLVRILSGVQGIVDYPSIKPGFDMVLDEILLDQQIKKQHIKRSRFFFKNIYVILGLSEVAINHFKIDTLVKTLQKCIPKMLDIFHYSLQIVKQYLQCEKTNILMNLYNSSDKCVTKRKCFNNNEIISAFESKENNIFYVFDFIADIVDVLNKIKFIDDDQILTASMITKLPNLTVKYFFCALHLEDQSQRSNAINRAMELLRYQSNKNKMFRQTCLRSLLEKGIFSYAYIFGSYEESEIIDVGIKENETLLEQNRRQIGPNSYRSVLHAGVIGEGLRKRSLDPYGIQPNKDILNFYLKAIANCCIDINKPNSPEGFIAMSLILVEFISTDVMYNGLPFPDEEFTKSTVERDLQIKRAFLLSPMLWSLLSLLAQYRPALCFSSVLLRAICSTCLLHWRARNVNKTNNYLSNDETMECTKKLLQIMSMGQLLPPPLSNLHYIISYFESQEISLILKECIWNYLKDHVPSPALFQTDKNDLNWRNPTTNKVQVYYTNVLKSLMQKKIHIFQSHYFDMYIMFGDKDVI